jgi:hypothetical protein
MACPTDGQLRAHHDHFAEPGSTKHAADRLRRPRNMDHALSEHLAGCAACARRMTSIQADARLAARQIAGLDEGLHADVDVDAALQATHPVASLDRRRWLGHVPATIAAAVVGLLVMTLIVATPSGRRAAASFLESFRAERIEVVTFDPQEPAAGLEELADIMDVDAEQAQPTVVDDASEAEQVAGFAPSTVGWLPDGVELQQAMAMPPTTVRLTFNDTAPDLPARLRGASLVVSVPGAVIFQYAPSGDVSGEELLMVAEADQLTAEAEGAELGDVREYLLSRPEVPDDVARQLLAIDDWTVTLPVPVPVNEINWRETTVAGQPGLVLEDPMGSGLLWQRDGRTHAVGGTDVDIDELRRIADGVGG